jgi:hypothetical protein
MYDAFTKQYYENLTKFVYFVFSITTVSIGYSISSTKDATCSYWLIIWLLSVLTMSYSLWCGIRHILKMNDSFCHAAKSIQIDEVLERLKDCKGWLKNYQPQTNSPSAYIEYQIIRVINDDAKNDKLSFNDYIEKTSKNDLKDKISSVVVSLLGYKNCEDAINKALSSEAAANQYIKKQLYALIIGFILFFIWHLSNIYHLNAAEIKAHVASRDFATCYDGV